ncbi:ribulose-5-phosphate 4-epimerase/fuculose-1-phosphate aldolase [Neobacillus niacini]|jgi:3-dehydro-4-phosphotetronate decarboxylase|uniref:class II aldolase/adducin family protein n=1 Tax=Neobacillus driksii TaxID=3035913 RepID=UPI00277DFDB7|nr:class II aldolase/adducin family protein [Neobacillus niacini]MDQ0972564.1 ribulose-5-phosphate 4-epimerase/fuculose-1-phosphate aldolase [Neobacillus niacini]
MVYDKKLELKRNLQDTGKYMMQYELAWGNSGNISAKTEENSFLITASGTYLGDLDLEDFAECSLDIGGSIIGERKPSKEVPMHRAIYETRPEIGAVLHASPLYSTMMAATNIDIPSDWFIESMYYLERVERVPYAHPGSIDLGELVREKAHKANILLLENHGVLVYDTSLKEAKMALQTLEMACKMLIISRNAGIDLQELPEDVVKSFLNEAGYKPRRRWEN